MSSPIFKLTKKNPTKHKQVQLNLPLGEYWLTLKKARIDIPTMKCKKESEF